MGKWFTKHGVMFSSANFKFDYLFSACDHSIFMKLKTQIIVRLLFVPMMGLNNVVYILLVSDSFESQMSAFSKVGLRCFTLNICSHFEMSARKLAQAMLSSLDACSHSLLHTFKKWLCSYWARPLIWSFSYSTIYWYKLRVSYYNCASLGQLTVGTSIDAALKLSLNL